MPYTFYQVSSQLDFWFRRRGSLQIFKIGFLIRIIFAIFYRQVTLILPTKFLVKWLSVQEKKFKIDFQDGHHLGFPIEAIWNIFYLQVALILPTKFQFNWAFCSGEEAQNRLSRWGPWRPSWISHRNNFISFLSISHLDTSYHVLHQLVQGCRRSINP